MNTRDELMAVDAQLAELESERTTAWGLAALTVQFKIMALSRRRARLVRALQGEGVSGGARTHEGGRS